MQLLYSLDQFSNRYITGHIAIPASLRFSVILTIYLLILYKQLNTAHFVSKTITHELIFFQENEQTLSGHVCCFLNFLFFSVKPCLVRPEEKDIALIYVFTQFRMVPVPTHVLFGQFLGHQPTYFMSLRNILLFPALRNSCLFSYSCATSSVSLWLFDYFDSNTLIIKPIIIRPSAEQAELLP